MVFAVCRFVIKIPVRVQTPSVEQTPSANFCRFACSSIGAKLLTALTGLALLGFVLGHLAGNLQMFAGPETFNAYAHWIKSKPGMLWGARLGLLAVLAVHMGVSVRLTLANRRARPVPYGFDATIAATPASRTMIWSGLAILAFVAYHLLHFTLGKVQPEYFHRTDALGHPDAYTMVVLGFGHLPIVAVYAIGMYALAMHLSHAIQSVLQTFGLNHPRYTPCVRRIGQAVAAGIAVAYLSIPVGVLAGIIRLPPGVSP